MLLPTIADSRTSACPIDGSAQSGEPHVAETIAAALPEDMLFALTTCRFCDERRCIDCPMEIIGLLDPSGSFSAMA